MKDVTFTIVMALGILALCLCIAQAIMDINAQRDGQLFNPYWPFTVEMQVRDK